MSIITKTTIAIAALGLSVSTIDTICLSRPKSVECSNALLGGDYSEQRKSVLKRLWGLYCELAAKRRGRLALGEMSDWQLRDIGVSAKDARQQSTVPFWR